MNFNYLPQSLKNEIEKYIKNEEPLTILRTSGALNGKSGEGYVFSYENMLLLFSRELGKSDYKVIQNSRARNGLNKFQIRNDKYSSFLDIVIFGKTLSAKFSNFDIKDAEAMVEKWKDCINLASPVIEASDAPNSAPSDNTLDEPQEHLLSPIVGLAAGLMYMAIIDGEIDKTEDYYIRYVCRNSKENLKEGLKYQKTHSYDQLLVDLSYIDHQQRLCMLANLLELGMTDGILHRSEQKIAKDFALAMEISKDEYQTISDVLLIKNQTSSLNA